MNLSNLKEWIGNKDSRTDELTAAPLSALAATLDAESWQPNVFPLAHWLYFAPHIPTHEIGTDGHARRGGFLPPVPLPRRMWASGRIRFHAPLQVGDSMTRESRITDVSIKEGRSGRLVFVRILHELHSSRGHSITEEQDLVYRDLPKIDGAAISQSPPPASETIDRSEAEYSREITPDPVLLFRYSALTFNSHRIHYDRSYATMIEGYPGLVVHGPLTATLLFDLLLRQYPGAAVRAFTFKALSPLFDIHPFQICGRSVTATTARTSRVIELWAQDHKGVTAMQARAEIAA